MVVTLLGQQHNTGEKPTVICALTLLLIAMQGQHTKKSKQILVHLVQHNKNRFVIIYSNSAIDPYYTMRACSLPGRTQAMLQYCNWYCKEKYKNVNILQVRRDILLLRV